MAAPEGRRSFLMVLQAGFLCIVVMHGGAADHGAGNGVMARNVARDGTGCGAAQAALGFGCAGHSER